MERPMHLLRFRSLIGVRLIRTLFHIQDEPNAAAHSKYWFDTHMNLDVHEATSCSQMLVNSKEDILFAMKVMSMHVYAKHDATIVDGAGQPKHGGHGTHVQLYAQCTHATVVFVEQQPDSLQCQGVRSYVGRKTVCSIYICITPSKSWMGPCPL